MRNMLIAGTLISLIFLSFGCLDSTGPTVIDPFEEDSPQEKMRLVINAAALNANTLAEEANELKADYNRQIAAYNRALVDLNDARDIYNDKWFPTSDDRARLTYFEKIFYLEKSTCEDMEYDFNLALDRYNFAHQKYETLKEAYDRTYSVR